MSKPLAGNKSLDLSDDISLRLWRSHAVVLAELGPIIGQSLSVDRRQPMSTLLRTINRAVGERKWTIASGEVILTEYFIALS